MQAYSIDMVGIFDSGSGGLTVLLALRNRLPSADVVYFADLAHVPYGSRSQAELAILTIEAIRRLQEAGATSIISACNSASTSLALSLLDALSLAPQSLIEMVGPTVAAFRHSSDRLLVCATQATVDSGTYQNAFKMLGKDVQMLAIPKLASAIEFGAPESEIESFIKEAFAGVSLGSVDGIVLACTHYPLALPSFRKVLGGKVSIYDPAEAVAERADKLFWPREAGEGKVQFILNRDSDHFRGLVDRFFPEAKQNILVRT